MIKCLFECQKTSKISLNHGKKNTFWFAQKWAKSASLGKEGTFCPILGKNKNNDILASITVLDMSWKFEQKKIEKWGKN